ncbi:hypothetical protein OH77DRAFT_116909 [Trametes cingulata]|nr:hypothetical protein OH77DRAFT_116909 [Trametes cingulata]
MSICAHTLLAAGAAPLPASTILGATCPASGAYPLLSNRTTYHIMHIIRSRVGAQRPSIYRHIDERPEIPSTCPCARGSDKHLPVEPSITNASSRKQMCVPGLALGRHGMAECRTAVPTVVMSRTCAVHMITPARAHAPHASQCPRAHRRTPGARNGRHAVQRTPIGRPGIRASELQSLRASMLAEHSAIGSRSRPTCASGDVLAD